MNNKRILHPFYIVFTFFQFVKALLPLFAIALLRKERVFDLSPLQIGILSAGIVLLLAIGYIQWKKFGFWLEEDRIIIRSGWLFKDEKTIYYSRIHSVYTEQKLLHRVLGIAQIKIETPGGKGQSDASLPALSLKYADEVSELLRSKQQKEAVSEQVETGEGIRDSALDRSVKDSEKTERAENGAVLKLTAADLMKAAATSMNFGLALAFIAGIYSFANNFIEMLLPQNTLNDAVESTGIATSGVLFISLIVLLIILFVWLLSIVLYVLKYSGFTISHQDSRMIISYGLLEKKSFAFDPKKVQAIIMKESILRQPFGYTELQLQVVSSGKEELLTLHPFVHRSMVNSLLERFISRFRLPEASTLQPAPARALINYLRAPLIIWISISIVLLLLFQWDGVWALAGIPLIMLWKISCHRSAAILLHEGQLTMRFRKLNRFTCCIRKQQITAFKASRTVGQAKKQLCSAEVGSMGSPFPYKVKCMDEKEIKPVWNWYSRTKNSSG